MMIEQSESNRSSLGDFFSELAKINGVDTAAGAAAKVNNLVKGIIKKPNATAPIETPVPIQAQVSEAVQNINWKIVLIGGAAAIGLILLMKKG